MNNNFSFFRITILAILLIISIQIVSFSQTLIAHYPMNNTTEDIVGYHKHLLTPNCTYENSSIHSIGKYATLENGECNIRANEINKLDINEFAFSVEIMTENIEWMNIIMFNKSCRLLGAYINDQGYFQFQMNNGEIKKATTVKCYPNKWYTITITYNKSTQKAEMYVNDQLTTTHIAPLSDYCAKSSYISKDIGSVDYGNGSTFKGNWKNLMVINGKYTPSQRSSLFKTNDAKSHSVSSTTNSNDKGTIPRFVHGQEMKSLNATEYRELAKTGVAFINFAQPTCDLAQYYIEMIADINKRLPQIPIYSFNKELYPEITKEFKLYNAQRFSMVRNGNYAGEYTGFGGMNMMEKWIITEWNKDKGTNIPLPNERFKTTYKQPYLDFNQYHIAEYNFNNSLNNKTDGNTAFIIDPKAAKIINNTLESNGKYTNEHSYLSGYKFKDFNQQNFSLYFEFLPHLTSSNHILTLGSSYRELSIYVYKGKLGFKFENGSFGYIDNVKIDPLSWNAIAISYDDSNKELQVVFNGKKIDNFKIDPNVEIRAGQSSIGLTNFSNGAVFYGNIDDINLYKTALKDDNLMNMYQNRATGFTNMNGYLPGNLIAEFNFNDKTNAVNGKEELTITSDASRLSNGTLYLSDEFKNSPIVLTEYLPGFNPANTTIMFDFNISKFEQYGSKLFSIGTYDHEFIKATFRDGDIDLQIDYYSTDIERNFLNLKSENKLITAGTWHNMIISFNEGQKQVYVYLNGREILNKKYNTAFVVSEMTDLARVVFQQYNYKGYTFDGALDNFKIYRTASTPTQIMNLYQGKSSHGTLSSKSTETSPSNHSQNLSLKLHEWSSDDYANFDYDKFSKLSVINQQIDPNDFDQDLMNACIFYQTNYQRRKFGSTSFTYKSGLEKAATMHSTDMAQYGFFHHVNPYDARKKEPHMRMEMFGITNGATSENIASRSESSVSYWFLAAQFLQQWMDSPGHRQNILDSRLNSLGGGVALINNGGSSSYYGTQNFNSLK